MPGDFFKQKPAEAKDKKEVELIEDLETLKTTFTFENKKYRNTLDQSYDALIPIRNELIGTGKDLKEIGMLNELRNYLKTSKIKEMTIGQRIIYIMKEIETLDSWSERLIQFLEKHVEAYQLLCESSFKIIEGLESEISEANRKLSEKEEHIEELTTEPGEIIIPPDNPRKHELVELYESLKSSLEFGWWVNPKSKGRELTPGERAYLKEVNNKVQKFTKKPQKPEKEPIKTPDLPEPTSEEAPYSPLSQNNNSKKPLKETAPEDTNQR